MSTNYNNCNEYHGFQEPIESGETSHLPEEPEEGQPSYEDHFRIECDYFNEEQIKSVLLPRFIMNPGLSFKEKGYLLLTFKPDHINGAYKNVLLATQRGEFETFKIHFLSSPEAGKEQTIVSSWSFTKARVHAIDFGYIARKRPDVNEFSVEIDYKGLEIDGVAI